MAIIITALTACQDDSRVATENQTPRTSQLTVVALEGQWIWTETTGSGIAGPYRRTAAELGNVEFLDFTHSGGLRIQYIANGQTTDNYFTYTLTETDAGTVIALYQGQTLVRKEFINVTDNQLELSNYESCCDNDYKSVYTKAKDF